jgi:hypothetical protein
MTANELLRVFLKDEQIAEKYGVTAKQAETMKVTDETSVFFIKVLQQCIIEHDRKNARAASNLKNFVEMNITEG